MQRTTPIAALFAATTLSCYVSENAAPHLVSIELAGAGEGGLVVPRSAIDIHITGTELWNRTASVEVEQTTASGAKKVLETLTTSFDRAPELQVADTRWIATGEALLAPGRSTIIFRASSEGQTLDSSPVFLDLDPRIDSVMLIGRASGERVQAGATISARITGHDVWARELEVDVLRRPEQGAPETLETQHVTFTDSDSAQTADVSWVVAGEFLERAGASRITFRARLVDQTVESDHVVVDVRSGIAAIRIFHELRGSSTLVEPQQAVPAIGRLRVEADGTGLVGQQATIAVLTQGAMIELDTNTFTINSNRLTSAFDLEMIDFGAEDSVVIYFRIGVGAVVADSAVVRVDRAGFLDCAWLGANGVPLEERATIASGTEVLLRGDTFGLDGQRGAFEIWESDGAAGSDFVALLGTQTASASANARWTAVYIDDGALQTEAEYYFTVDIGGRQCRSGMITVRD